MGKVQLTRESKTGYNKSGSRIEKIDCSRLECDLIGSVLEFHVGICFGSHKHRHGSVAADKMDKQSITGTQTKAKDGDLVFSLCGWTYLMVQVMERRFR